MILQKSLRQQFVKLQKISRGLVLLSNKTMSRVMLMIQQKSLRQQFAKLQKISIELVYRQLGAGQAQAYDPTEVAKTTIRQTTEDLKRVVLQTIRCWTRSGL